MRRILKTKWGQSTGKLFFAALISGFVMTSCTYYTNDYDPLVVPDNLSFEADIVPIFETKCNSAGCHNGSIAPDLRADNAFKGLTKGNYVNDDGNADNDLLYQKIDKGGSMEVYATDLERAFIKKWIEEGAQNN